MASTRIAGKTVYQSADFTGCRFSHSKLSKVDFQGSVFVDCVFEGRLEDVQFYRQGFRGEDLHPNEMKGVDLRAARLHFVEFRDLDMEDVVWPEDDDHIIVNDYRQTLDRVLRALSTRTDDVSRSLRVLLDMKRKWAGPKQRTGVVGKSDLREAGGEAAVELFLDLCARHAQR